MAVIHRQSKGNKEVSSRYVLHEVCRGQYRFTLTSHRGQVLLTSGLYMDKESALRKINATRRLARNARNYDLLTAEDEGRYFTVVTRKGETLAYSAIYPNAEGRQAAINLVKANTRGARLEDLTQGLADQQERPVPSGRFAGMYVYLHPQQGSELAHSTRQGAENIVAGALARKAFKAGKHIFRVSR